MKMTKSNEPVIDAIHVTKLFPVMKGIVEGLFRGSKQKYVHAVDDVSFTIQEGETFGLVGESGCGKSTTGMLLLQLLNRTSGTILYKGMDVASSYKWHVYVSRVMNAYFFLPIGYGLSYIFRSKESRDSLLKVINEAREEASIYKEKLQDQEVLDRIKNLRREIQIIFQNPYDSLSPRFNVLDIVAEPLRLLKVYPSEAEVEQRVLKELDSVGLVPPEDFINRFPHELSGGQRQRVGVARAFTVDPEFIVADEPVSMLDVSVRVGILRTMNKLSKDRGTAFLFITHDLALARVMCDQIAVMYLGRIVEQGPTEEILHNPLHPYTKALIVAVPKPDPDAHRTEDLPIIGEVPSGIDIAPGCRFSPRCIYAIEECSQIDPQLETVKKGYQVACIRYKEINKIK
ncbi:MAG: oligopeptide/dipeptide ABC transporter ATP-binding protein [Candidatus Heimdallarchaeaceae archaeon]